MMWVFGVRRQVRLVRQDAADRLEAAGDQARLAPLLLAAISRLHLGYISAISWRYLAISRVQLGLFVSGMAFYLYNELATMTIKKTGPVTASVANTAKRAAPSVDACKPANQS